MCLVHSWCLMFEGIQTLSEGHLWIWWFRTPLVVVLYFIIFKKIGQRYFKSEIKMLLSGSLHYSHKARGNWKSIKFFRCRSRRLRKQKGFTIIILWVLQVTSKTGHATSFSVFLSPVFILLFVWSQGSTKNIHFTSFDRKEFLI